MHSLSEHHRNAHPAPASGGWAMGPTSRPSCGTRPSSCAGGGTAFMSLYDAAAPSFDRHRALPDGVAPAIRAAVLASVGEVRQPRLLDLGAGTGRIGWPFVAAGDDYVGIDLSLGMLRAFMGRAECSGAPARLAQADGQRLPFPDATFDRSEERRVGKEGRSRGAADHWKQNNGAR